MSSKYILGVAVAVLCGVINNAGVLLQKKVVNDIPAADRDRRFFLTLVKNPLWLLGFFLQFMLGAVVFIIAQSLIGPALVPGLMASGLIVLALGSVWLIGETLNQSEYVGIFLMIGGTLLLGLSKLEIGLTAVRDSLAAQATLLRIGAFTLGLCLLWGLSHLASLSSRKRKGIVMGFSNGFPFALSNFWVSPLTALIGTVLAGKGNAGQVALFALASVILVGANLLGIRQNQESFKFGQASNIIPVQQISVQIAPVLVYFFVYFLTPPSRLSALLIVLGAALIIAAGFLLGRRQSELEKIH